MERIETSPARGMKDYLPAEAALRDWMLEVILETYTSRGFQRIETPALENLERLIGSGGGENEKLIFKVLKRGEKLELSGSDENALADLGLRFDLTVPLARYWAHNQPKLPPVFRAIQIGPVWRAERPQRGRFRQFLQCDIDIVGEPSVLAEMELIAVSVEVARKLGVKAPVLRFNDRRFLDAVLGWAGVPADVGGAVLVALDKLDKIGQEGVLAEIGRLELEGSVTGRLARFVAESSAGEQLPAGLFKEIGLAEEVVGDMEAIASLAGCSAMAGTALVFDPTVIRGMGYYTGPIYELGVAELGFSIGGGGRYDEMLGRFGRPAPACGFSLGFERISLYLHEQGAHGALVAPELHLRIASAADYPAALAMAERAVARGVRASVEGASKKLGAVIRHLREERAGVVAAPRSWVAVAELSKGELTVHDLTGNTPDLGWLQES